MDPAELRDVAVTPALQSEPLQAKIGHKQLPRRLRVNRCRSLKRCKENRGALESWKVESIARSQNEDFGVCDDYKQVAGGVQKLSDDLWVRSHRKAALPLPTPFQAAEPSRLSGRISRKVAEQPPSLETDKDSRAEATGTPDTKQAWLQSLKFHKLTEDKPAADLEKLSDMLAKLCCPEYIQDVGCTEEDLRTAVVKVLGIELDLLWLPYRQYFRDLVAESERKHQQETPAVRQRSLAKGIEYAQPGNHVTQPKKQRSCEGSEAVKAYSGVVRQILFEAETGIFSQYPEVDIGAIRDPAAFFDKHRLGLLIYGKAHDKFRQECPEARLQFRFRNSAELELRHQAALRHESPRNRQGWIKEVPARAPSEVCLQSSSLSSDTESEDDGTPPLWGDDVTAEQGQASIGKEERGMAQKIKFPYALPMKNQGGCQRLSIEHAAPKMKLPYPLPVKNLVVRQPIEQAAVGS